MMISCTNNSNPLLQEWNTPYGIPPFDEIALTDYIPAVKQGIKEQKKELEAILANPDTPTFENTVAAWELSGKTLDRVSGLLFNLCETEADDAMNAVVEEATALITEHEDDIAMNQAFFERVKAVHDADQSRLTREQQMVLKKLYQSFTRSGVGLDEASQARLREINQTLAAAQQKFGNRLLAENNAFKEKFGIPVSAYTSEMTTCADRARREEMFRAYSSRGNNGDGNDTKALCLEILRLRAEKARMLGFDTFAAYQLDDKMAHDPATVDAFLEQMKKDTGVTAMDIAKALLDGGIHPPTMYFPLIVHEALMVEPTETETKETLDEVIDLFRKVYEEAIAHPETMAEKPEHTPIRRPDEVQAARNPIIRYAFED